MKFKAPRGTKDVLPDEAPLWRQLEETVRDICGRYNYQEIRIPTFEETELFRKSTGVATDIVGKEMYTFQDKGGRSLTLSPEATPPVIRAYLQHNLGRASPHLKLFYISRMFRQEKPQAGRLRQHTQFGVEAIGSPEPLQDVEVISLLFEILEEAGLSHLMLKLNSVGCSRCVPEFRQTLQDYLRQKLEALCPDCRRRFRTNPLRILDCKKEGCRAELESAPSILSHLCDDCAAHFDRVKSCLGELEVPYEVDPHLVRGLDYYTRTVFEVVSPHLGAQDALGGGGRYDNLIGELGGEPTPAIGFGAGMERLILAVKQEGGEISPTSRLDLYVATLGDQATMAGLKLLQQLRRQGVNCDTDYLNRSLKAQLRAADKLRARSVLIIGEEELSKGVALYRDMSTHQQTKVVLGERVVDEIKRNLDSGIASTDEVK